MSQQTPVNQLQNCSFTTNQQILLPNNSTKQSFTFQDQAKKNKVQELKKWMKEKGCRIHPHVQIPAMINGVQGVATNKAIPPKTLIIAVPSSLILTVSKCYKDPQLKSVFSKNDQLFDYQASQDAQFSILCVFLMFHKLNIQKSPWKIYLQTIGEPQTAIDWPNSLLKGLNKSMIQQILHIRIQCDKLRQTLTQYLKTTEQFKKISIQQLRSCFNYCYRAVMTRCFGYYFNQASLIPVADLINHGCQAIDHQLINTKYEKFQQFNQAYKQKSSKIDCSLMGIKRGKNIQYPWRQRFLLQNKLIEDEMQVLTTLDRKSIDEKIYQFNNKLFKQDGYDIDKLQFCEQNDQQDNDTDQQEQNQRQIQLKRLQTEQLQQIQNFKKYFESVKVETYKQVQDRYQKYQKQLMKQDQMDNSTNDNDGKIGKQSKNDILISQSKEKQKGNQDSTYQIQQITESLTQVKLLNTQVQNTSSQQTNQIKQVLSKQNHQPKEKDASISSVFLKPNQQKQANVRLHESIQRKAVVPVQMVESSQQQSEDDEDWGLQPQSYFTMSTSSAVGPNRELFNSYGSRTNKFLLIWYGFCYRDNLYDSVTLRLHVVFSHKKRPSAKDLILDTYVGGQGLSFRKNQKQELVKGNEVSKQFRIKRNSLSLKLLTFLRLYLLEYYKGSDLYKVCVTIPSSLQFQRYLFSYYKQIVEQLYERYPISIIQELKKDELSAQTAEQDRIKIKFKIIYLEQQRKILDEHMGAVKIILEILNNNKISQDKQKLSRQVYSTYPIQQIRKIRPYLMILKNNFPYLMYEHKSE